MKKQVELGDYQAYKKKTNGCLSLKKVHYVLRDVATQEVLLSGELIPTEEAFQLVKGTHPSRNIYDSAIGAALDLATPGFRQELIKAMSQKVLQSVPIPQVQDPFGGQGRRAKALTWGVVAIDEDTDEVWVEGVV